MDRELASVAIVELITSLDDHRDVLDHAEPPDRPVDIRRRSWEAWLRDGGRPGTASYVGPLEHTRIAASVEVLRTLTPRDPERRGADHEINRSHLVALSERAAKSNERRCTSLWVATMMWGSGTLNGRGPWRTAEGLAADELGSLLTQSHRNLRDGDLASAYEVASRIPGSGEATFTKWLWAASLGLPEMEVPPLILDGRVRAALARHEVRPSHRPAGYVDYCSAMQLAASRLRTSHAQRSTTPERLELLLGRVI